MTDSDISTRDALALLTTDERAVGDPYLLDRRRFLQLLGMGVGGGLVLGGSGSLFDAVASQGRPAWAAGPLGPEDGVLVLMGMYGGNDGLDTVVPVGDGTYFDVRGSTALDPTTVHRLDDHSGLHPELTGLHGLWERGEVAIVEGVGYPNPDLSHFNSMAYWMSGRPHQVPSSGWLGRWLDGYLAGSRDLFAAAEIGTGLPLHLVGATQRGTVVPDHRPSFGADDSDRARRAYDAIRAMAAAAADPWGSAIGQACVDQLDLAATIAPVYPDTEPGSDVEIVSRMEIAARLINANLGFRVLTVGWGDFDSHAGQPNQHGQRMREFDAAVARFFETLDPAIASRVTVMTFSEFGRTPWGNDGDGTDHGTSAPMFVIGRNVRGGFHGQRPRLAGLGRWDRLEHHVDFRSYYASVLDGWLGGGSTEILGGSFEDLGLFAAGPGSLPGGGGGSTTQPGFVPIAPQRFVDTRIGSGAPLAPIGAGSSLRVPIVGRAGIPGSGVEAVVATVTSVAASSSTYFTVHPGGGERPYASNLNPEPGRAVPNLVVVPVGADGSIEVFNANGASDCLVDVCGYTVSGVAAGAAPATRLTAVDPRRLFDSRVGFGVPSRKLVSERPVSVLVAGRAGVPSSGATAVVLNLVATEAESGGFLRLTPSSLAARETSNVNFEPGDTVANLAICPLGEDGRILLDAHGSGTHVVGDVFGYFGPAGGVLTARPPVRVLDTRDGTGALRGPVDADRTIDLRVAGVHGVPAEASAIVLNVTVTNVDASSYVSVWPSGRTHPGTSNLNLAPGRTVANLVVCRVGDGGAVSISNHRGTCDVVADVLGYVAG